MSQAWPDSIPSRRIVQRRRSIWTFPQVIVLTGLCAASACEVDADPSSDGPVEITVTAVTTISPGADPFGQIVDLEIGDDGLVYVLDGLTHTVRVFDVEGNELRSFARRGQGPGELRAPTQLTWGGPGRLWILDLGNSRVSSFDRGGDPIDSYRPVDLPLVFPYAMAFSANDTLEWVGLSSADISSPAAAWVQTVLARGEVRPTDVVELPLVHWPEQFEYYGAERSLVLPVPFAGEPIFGFDLGGGLWYANTAVPQLHRVSSTGGVDLTIAIEAEPIPIGASDREEALSTELTPEDLQALRAIGQSAVAELSGLIPDARPSLAGFFFDDEERVWVVHAEGDARGSSVRPVDVYQLDGALIGRARLALAASPRPRLRDGLIAAVVRSELGEESVALYRVQP